MAVIKQNSVAILCKGTAKVGLSHFEQILSYTLSYIGVVVDIGFSRWCLVFNICCGPRSILMPYMKLQQMLNMENPWSTVNLLLPTLKFISSPFGCLFSTIISIFSPSFWLLYRDIRRHR